MDTKVGSARIKFSIIIVSKDVVQYIGQCIFSVITQQYLSYEIIIIDDGSSDGTSEVIELFANDERVTIITTIGVGLGKARNLGMDLSHGLFLLFVDGDDFLSPECLTELSDCIDWNRKVSLVMFDWNKVNENGSISHREPNSKLELHKGIACWNKCYSRSLVREARFTENSKFEDVGFHLVTRLNSRTTVYLKSALYNYRFNPNGITKTNNGLKDEMDVLNGLNEFIKKYPNFDLGVRECIVRILNKHLLSGIVKSKKQDLNPAWQFIKRNKLVAEYIRQGNKATLLLIIICLNFSTLLYWTTEFKRFLKSTGFIRIKNIITK